MYGLLAVLVILGPLFFIPVRSFSVSSSKGFLILFIGVLGLLSYGIYVLRKGVLIFPRQKIFITLLLLVLSGVLGSFLSSGFAHAFLGYGFETTSWLFLALFALIIFFSYLVLNSYQRIGVLYGGMFLVFIVFALTHILRYLVGPAFANLGVLGGTTATLMGSWGDLGMFFGLTALFCAITLELAGLKKAVKWVVASTGLVAVVLLMVMNISIVWIVLGLVTLILSLYLFSFAYWDTEAHSYKKTERVPWFMLTLFIISVISIFFGGFFNNLASRHQNLAWSDVRPSWGITLKVTERSFAHNFVTGYGPNSFGGAWSLLKPKELSGGDISQADFNQGVGFIPTQIATNGILSAILWVLFFIGILRMLIRKTRAGFKHSLDRYFAIGIGSSILYLGVLAWVYVPGSYLLILLAVLIGAFISLFDNNSEKGDRVFSFIKDPRASFFGILGVTILIVGTLLLGYIGLRKTISFVHYTKGMVALNQGKPAEANVEITTATGYAKHDIYHQQLAVFALNDVGQIASKGTSANKEAISSQVEQLFGIALAHAQVATQINSIDYKNWKLLGDVYRTMLNLGVTDAYAGARDAYTEAQKRNPNDSTRILSFAELALANKDVEAALGFIKESITMYPTSDAYILRAQIQLSQQNNDLAGESLKAAVAIDPYNADLAYQYGLLLLKQRSYRDAVSIFQRVISINRNYAIAYVYLGYAYERAGDMTNANQVYRYIKEKFPGGDEAVAAVKNSQIDQPAPVIDPITPDTKDTSKLPVKGTVAPTPKK